MKAAELFRYALAVVLALMLAAVPFVYLDASTSEAVQTEAAAHARF